MTSRSTASTASGRNATGHHVPARPTPAASSAAPSGAVTPRAGIGSGHTRSSSTPDSNGAAYSAGGKTRTPALSVGGVVMAQTYPPAPANASTGGYDSV